MGLPRSEIEELHSLSYLHSQIVGDKNPDGFRIGSRFGQSKLRPNIRQGILTIQANPNESRAHEEAQRTADLYVLIANRFLQYCDQGKFNPKEVLANYQALDSRLQANYDLVKAKQNADYSGIIPDGQRVSLPNFLYDDFSLEALLGSMMGWTKANDQMETKPKPYSNSYNPSAMQEYEADELTNHVGENGLLTFDEIRAGLEALTKSKQQVAIGRTLYDLRQKNSKIPQAFENAITGFKY